MFFVSGDFCSDVKERWDAHEEDAIGEAAQALHLAEAVGELLATGPLAGDSGDQPNKERHAVEEHVDGVAEEA